MKRLRGFLKKYRGQLLLTLILMLVILAAPFESRYSRGIEAEDLLILSDALEIATYIEDEDILCMLSLDGTEGYTSQTGGITLKKGTYTLQVVGIANADGNYIEVYNDSVLNEDNTEGSLLARTEVLTDGELTEVSFTVDDSLSDIDIYFYYGGEGYYNVSSLYMFSQNRIYYDPFIYMALVLIASAAVLAVRVFRGDPYPAGRRAFVILGAAVILTSLPLTFPFLLDGNDLYFHFNRILAIEEALKSGQFPVMIHSMLYHGYGYGTPIFYPELFLYIPAALGLCGLSLIGCYKILLIGINIATAAASYISFAGITKSRGTGLVASLLYTLSIYRLIDLYSRAAVGEALAMIFLPVAAWGIYEIFMGDQGKWYIAALGYIGVAQSHLLSTELVFVFCVLYGLISIKRLREHGRLKALLLAAGATVLGSLNVLIPVIRNSSYEFFGYTMEIDLSEWTVPLVKLFDIGISNAAGEFAAGIQSGGEMPVSLGVTLIIGIAAFICVYVRDRGNERGEMSARLLPAFVLALVGIYLSCDFFPWDRVQSITFINRLVTTVQLPWRFIALSTVLLCPVAAVSFQLLSSDARTVRMLNAALILIAFVSAGMFISSYCEEGEVKYTAENQYQSGQLQTDSMYLLNIEGVSRNGLWNRDDVFTASDGVELLRVERGDDATAGFDFENDGAADEAYVDVSLTWYADYHAYLEDGTELETGVGEDGVLRVYLPDGEEEGSVSIVYKEPAYVSAARVLSVLVWAAVTVIAVNSHRREKSPETA